MNRQVNAIAGRLSLRPPQRRSLEILDCITTVALLGNILVYSCERNCLSFAMSWECTT